MFKVVLVILLCIFGIPIIIFFMLMLIGLIGTYLEHRKNNCYYNNQKIIDVIEICPNCNAALTRHYSKCPKCKGVLR